MVVDLPTFTLIHVVISVVGIIAGLVVVGGLMAGARLDVWTGMFLACTAFTSISGFGFPFTVIAPAHVVGVLSLLLLALCLTARYGKQMNRGWRTTYVVTAVMALYLNVFVLVVQLFTKTPPLAQLAPTQSEAPFAVTQGLVLALFAWLGWASLRGFRPPQTRRA
jgi:hypothetical protein